MAGETLKEFFIKVNFDTSGFDKLRQSTAKFTENVTSKFKIETDKQVQIQKKANDKLIKGTQSTADKQISILKNMAKLLPAIFSTAFIKSSVSDFVKKGMEADETSSLLGISPEAFQQISGAFNRFGVESSSMASQLSSVNKQIQQAEKGTGRLKIVLEKFGLTIKNANGEVMSADEFLLSMSEQLKGFDGKTRGAILAMMGFDNSIQSAFSDGGEALMGFLEKQKELMLITQKDTEMAKKFTFQMKDLRDQITRIKNAIARFFLPALTSILNILEKLINWAFKHKGVITTILSLIAYLLSPILIKLIKILAIGLKIAAPFIAIGAAVLGLILIFEDLYYYFNGMKSATGELVKKFPSLETALKPIEPIVKTISQAFSDIVEFFKNPSFDNFTAIFENLARGVINLAQQWGDVFIDVLASSLNGYIDLFKFLDDLLTEIFTNLKNYAIDKINEISIFWDGIDWIETFKNMFNADFWLEQINKLKKFFFDLFDSVVDYFKNIFQNALNFISEKISGIFSPIKDLKNSVSDKMQGVKDKASQFVEKTKNLFNVTNNEKTNNLITNNERILQPLPVVNNSNAYATNNYNNNHQNINVEIHGNVSRSNADYLANSIGKQVKTANFQNGNNGRF